MSLNSFGASLAIRTKILASFAAILLVLAVLGATALTRLSAMNRAVDNVFNDGTASLVDLDKMRVSVSTFRATAQRELVMGSLNDQAGRKAAQDKLASLVASYQAAEKQYQPLVSPGEEQQLYGEVTAASGAYMGVYGKVRDLLDAGKVADATTMALQTMVPAGDKFDAALAALMDLNVRQAHAQADEAGALYDSGILYVAILLMLALVIAGVGCVFLIGGIAGPIRQMTAAMRRLAAHELAVDIPALGRTDEIGQMADAVQVFKDGLANADRMAAEQAAERTAKDRRAQRLESSVATFENSARELVGKLAGGAHELQDTASTMLATAERTKEQANDIAVGAKAGLAGMQTAAAAAEELTASITEISRQVANSTKITSRAVTDAQRTNVLVATLAEAAEKIGNVVGLITTIAGQTNLLALNATIEAARAGDAGKGFAVVASEVKNLASQTARATEEIGQQITQIQAATKEAVAAIRGIGATIEEVSTISTSIAAAVEQQGAATAEIARSVQATAATAEEATAGMGSVGAAANDTGAAAGQVLGAAGALARQAEQLSTDVNRFVSDVRAA